MIAPGDMQAHATHIGMARQEPRGAFNRVLSFLWGGLRGYDAVDGSNRRRSVTHIAESTDSMHGQEARKRAASEVRDVYRNFSLAAWAIRKHLDYTTCFGFQTPDEQFKSQVMEWAKPLNFDVRGMHGLPEFLRMMEERRTVDGDVFALKLSSGLLQAIEGDRVRQPAKAERGQTWINGVRVSKAGRAQSYAIWDRAHNDYIYNRTVRAGNAYWLGYCDRFDQVRGVSPLMAAANSLRDLYESHTYELAKGKVLAALGLKVTRQALDNTDEASDSYTDAGFTQSKAFGAAPWLLEMEPGDDAEFMTATTPSNEWQNFASEMTRLCLAALDIPFSFFNGQGYNFSQSKADWIHYRKATAVKQKSLIWFLDSWTKWRISLEVLTGRMSPRRAASLEWEWLPEASPWWNPVDEVQAAVMEIQAGLGTRSDYTMAMKGKRFEEVVARLEEEEAILEAAGIPVVRSTRFYQPLDEQQPTAASVVAEESDAGDMPAAER